MKDKYGIIQDPTLKKFIDLYEKAYKKNDKETMRVLFNQLIGYKVPKKIFNLW